MSVTRTCLHLFPTKHSLLLPSPLLSQSLRGCWSISTSRSSICSRRIRSSTNHEAAPQAVEPPHRSFQAIQASPLRCLSLRRRRRPLYRLSPPRAASPVRHPWRPHRLLLLPSPPHHLSLSTPIRPPPPSPRLSSTNHRLHLRRQAHTGWPPPPRPPRCGHGRRGIRREPFGRQIAR